jgi:hypothetical protein
MIRFGFLYEKRNFRFGFLIIIVTFAVDHEKMFQ